jgi:flotillin
MHGKELIPVLGAIGISMVKECVIRINKLNNKKEKQMENVITGPSIGIFIGIAVLLFIIIIAAIGYVKCPPDKVYIISGFRKEPKFITGTSAIRIPFLQQKDELTLEMIKVNVVTDKDIPTSEYINIQVDANVNVKIDREKLKVAAQHFLNANDKDIAAFVCDVLQGNLREIVGKMKLEDMIKDRTAFNKAVTDSVKPDLAAMGLELVSFNVQNFSDKNDVIYNMGIDNVETIRKTAEIAKANARRDIAVAEAAADKEANDARVASDMAIAEKNNELEIRKAGLKKTEDTKKAEADKAYDIEIANQQKTINIVNAEAEAAKQEKLVEVRKKEVEVTEMELQASIIKKAEASKQATIIEAEGEREAKIIAAEADKETTRINAEASLLATQKSADADKYKKQTDAEAALFQQEKDAEAELIKKNKESDAIRYNKEQEAEAAKATAAADLVKKQKEAEADQYSQERNAEGVKAMAAANLEAAQAEAKGIAAKGQAEGIAKKNIGDGEAAAIKAKGLAEAEAIDKKAEALTKMNETGKLDMQLEVTKLYVEKLPDVAGAVGKAFASVGKIEMYGNGNETKLAENVMGIVNQIGAGLGSAFGGNGKDLLASFFGAKAALAGSNKKED